METPKKISAFEFAIMKIADPEEAKKHQSYTREEENKIRVDKLMNQSKRMYIKLDK